MGSQVDPSRAHGSRASWPLKQLEAVHGGASTSGPGAPGCGPGTADTEQPSDSCMRLRGGRG